MDRAEGPHIAAECLELARRCEDPALLALATRELAIYTLRCGDGPVAAQPLLEEAIARQIALVPQDAEGITMTQLSLGMALLFQGDTTRAMLGRANHAMLQAKAQGKNRVVAEKRFSSIDNPLMPAMAPMGAAAAAVREPGHRPDQGRRGCNARGAAIRLDGTLHR